MFGGTAQRWLRLEHSELWERVYTESGRRGSRFWGWEELENGDTVEACITGGTDTASSVLRGKDV